MNVLLFLFLCCRHSNEVLLGCLREDEQAAALLEQTRLDASTGRMSEPIRAEDADLSSMLLVPRCFVLACFVSGCLVYRSFCLLKCLCFWLVCCRFSVTKMKEDGSLKVRPVDNFSWAAVERGTKVAPLQLVACLCLRLPFSLRLCVLFSRGRA